MLEGNTHETDMTCQCLTKDNMHVGLKALHRLAMSFYDAHTLQPLPN